MSSAGLQPPQSTQNQDNIFLVEGAGKSVSVVPPKSVFTRSGAIYQIPDATTKAVDDFEVPHGYRREGARESSFMYSIGVFIRPLDSKNTKCKYFCLADAKCRAVKTEIPCKSGDRGNVNKHHKKRHDLVGVASVTKQENKEAREGPPPHSTPKQDVFLVGGAHELVWGGSVTKQEEKKEAREGPPPHSTQKQDILLVEGAGKSVPVVSPKSVFTRSGEVYQVPDATTKAVDDFEVPSGYRKEGARESSFMYSLGVFIRPLDSNDTKCKYFCLADAECRSVKTEIPCKSGDRGNVNKHHKKGHELFGVPSATQQEKEARETIEKNFQTNKNSATGTDRVRELMAVKLVVEKFLPFSFFSSGETWRELVEVLTATTKPFPPLSSRRIKHLIVETYVATKKEVIGNMQEEIAKALLPIIHYQVDLSTCEASGRQFLRTHAQWVDSSFKLRHALLAVKHCAPSSEAQDRQKASEILLTIFRATLGEYGIRIADLAGGTTDSGPEVKAMCVNLLAVNDVCWDWCDCHLACKAAENAFGTSADPHQSKNPGARSIFSLLSETAARVNQSASFRQKFEELQIEMLNDVFKSTKHTPQRWMGLVCTLERVIRLWHVFRRVHAELGLKFLLDEGDKKNAVLQLYSLLQALFAITRDGQHGAVPMTAEMHMAFAVLKMEVLDPAKPLTVFDIPSAPGSPEEEQERGKTRKGENPPLPSRMVSPDKLHPIAIMTRKELSKTLVQRLFGRVWNPNIADPSPFRDLAVILTPPFNTGKYLEGLRLNDADKEFLAKEQGYLAPTTDLEVKNKLTGIWTDLKTRAVKAAREGRKRAAQEDDDEVQTLKRARVDGDCSRSPASMFASFGWNADIGGADNSRPDAVVKAVKSDVMWYQAHYMSPEELDPKAVLAWWASKGKHRYPYLAPVAQQVFGNQASAAQVECDFSCCGNLLPPNRSRMDTYWVEMVMFLKANFEQIPENGAIPSIAAKDIRSCLPTRFTGQDEDLVAAEATFDLLNNTAAPTADGMALD